MWKVFRNSTARIAPQASILFDELHILRHLGDGLNTVRRQEYARLCSQYRKFIRGPKYALLSHPGTHTGDARLNFKRLLAANQWLNTTDLLKESFGQLWEFASEV